MLLLQTTFINIVTKGESALDEQFPLIPQCFPLYSILKLSFIEIFYIFVSYLFEVTCCSFEGMVYMNLQFDLLKIMRIMSNLFPKEWSDFYVQIDALIVYFHIHYILLKKRYMWKSSQLLGKIVVWSTGVRKPGNA